MVLTHTGTFYLANVISKTNPSDFPSCDFLFPSEGRSTLKLHGFSKLADGMLGKLRKTLPAKVAGAASMTYEGEDPDTKYFQSFALITSGPVTISSHKYNIPYSQGYMEFVEWFQTDTVPVPAAEVTGLYLVEPNTFTLRVQRPHYY
jgi:hypothetical protein